MKKPILYLFFLFFALVITAQETDRQLILGQVLYRGSNVINENVYNSNTEVGTVTDEDGRFSILVKLGDKLLFTAVNYELMVFDVTQEMLDKNRLVVEVTEKVTALDEVVVGPENQEKFLEIKNEKFKEFEYEIDRGTEVQNVAYLTQNDRIEGRINFVNIFKAIINSKNKEAEEGKDPLKLSDVMRQVYDDDFFVTDLKLPQDKIDAFLLFCDDKVDAKSLLHKDKEFQLIDVLVTHSISFLESLEEE